MCSACLLAFGCAMSLSLPATVRTDRQILLAESPREGDCFRIATETTLTGALKVVRDGKHSSVKVGREKRPPILRTSSRRAKRARAQDRPALHQRRIPGNARQREAGAIAACQSSTLLSPSARETRCSPIPRPAR